MNIEDKFINEYHLTTKKKRIFLIICLLSAVVIAILSVGIGQYSISFTESFTILIDHLLGNPVEDTLAEHVVWDNRIPRILMAFFAGMGLSVCGAVMQNIMRNPLAEPYTMGVASGASLGAILAIVLGISVLPFVFGPASIVVNAFIFSLIPVALILLVAKFRKVTPTMMILIGIATMYMFGAVTTTVMVMADPSQLADAYAWRVGTLGKAEWYSAIIVAVVVILVFVIILLISPALNILSAGDSLSKTLGLSPEKFRISCFGVIALGTCTIVSFTGTIGFIGLVAPHIVRIFVGSDCKYLIPCSAAFGGIFLMILDLISKIVSWNGLPVGVISAIIGGPVFILVLIRQRKNSW